nr:MAG TPA: hypothetical protein [Caudoviricetes sp.]
MQISLFLFHSYCLFSVSCRPINYVGRQFFCAENFPHIILCPICL